MRELNVNEMEAVNGGIRLNWIYRGLEAILVGTTLVDAINDFVDGFEEGYNEKDEKKEE